jgi:hypothetical protein
MLSSWACGDDIANLDFFIDHHHPVNEQFYQLTLLLKTSLS